MVTTTKSTWTKRVSEGEGLGQTFKGEITPAIRAAVKRVHAATGHRPAKRREGPIFVRCVWVLQGEKPTVATMRANELCREFKAMRA